MLQLLVLQKSLAEELMPLLLQEQWLKLLVLQQWLKRSELQQWWKRLRPQPMVFQQPMHQYDIHL